MELRTLGRTGLRVSTLGFGCGNVGGLMIRGTPAEQERGVARAVELGVNYFDTAPSYGDGASETNLGRVLRALRPPVYVGTKVRLAPGDLTDVRGAVARSLEASLGRLGLPRVDLLQLHNRIGATRGPDAVSVEDVLREIVPAMTRLREQGKTRFVGITALGETAALHRVLAAGVLDTAQVCCNLLNPSAAVAVPPGFPAQDFERLLGRAREHEVGTIVIRVLAAGALSATEARHPVAVPSVEPIATAADYGTDVARARTLGALVSEGHATDLVEASLRFAAGADAVSTILVGYSSLQHLEAAAAAVNRGPLPPAALARLTALWRSLAAAR